MIDERQPLALPRNKYDPVRPAALDDAESLRARDGLGGIGVKCSLSLGSEQDRPSADCANFWVSAAASAAVL